MTHNFHHVFLIFLCCIFFNCKSYKHKKTSNLDASSIDTIPKTNRKFYENINWQKHFTVKQKLLKIESIQKGVTDWEIRFWIEHGFRKIDSAQLLIFKKENGIEKGLMYLYDDRFSDTVDPITSISSIPISLSPTSGWQVFIDTIEKLGLYNLPDLQDLPGFARAADSDGVIVEFAIKNKYRIYAYDDYEGFLNKIEEAKKMHNILNFIEKEFKIRTIY